MACHNQAYELAATSDSIRVWQSKCYRLNYSTKRVIIETKINNQWQLLNQDNLKGVTQMDNANDKPNKDIFKVLQKLLTLYPNDYPPNSTVYKLVNEWQDKV